MAASGAPNVRSVGRMLLLTIGLPLVAIQVLLHRGAAPQTALLVAAIFPVIEIALEYAKSRRVGMIALISLAGMVAGFGLAFLTGNPVYALLKDSVFTCALGLLFIGSLALPRPLIYRLNLDLAGADAGARAATEALWELAPARRAFRLMTLVWGLGLLLEAMTRLIVTMKLPLATATALSPVIALVAVGGLIGWTVTYARALRRRRPPAPNAPGVAGRPSHNGA